MSENNKLWWVSLNGRSPRFQDWLNILGFESANDVPLVSSDSGKAQLGPEEDEVFLLDWHKLSTEQQDRLIRFIADKFQASDEEVRADVERDGHFPIRTSDVSVFFSLRAFI